MNNKPMNCPPDYSSITDEELEQIIKDEYPTSDRGFGAIAERHRREHCCPKQDRIVKS